MFSRCKTVCVALMAMAMVAAAGAVSAQDDEALRHARELLRGIALVDTHNDLPSLIREYAGSDIAEYRQPGSNGLTLDGEGRLTIDEHGNRRVTRLERNGQLTVLADRYEGKRLNSPNDLVYRSDGSLYFTDPPFGLPKVFDDPRKELPYSGVYHWADGTLRLVAKDLAGPNGIAGSAWS